jgi:hypothetical protein
VILLSKDDKRHIQAPWQSVPIIKAFGKSVGFKYMDFKIRSLWQPKGDMQCIDLGLDFFLVRFKLAEDYWKVVNEGPWFLRQQFLSLRRWTPGFRPFPIELYDVGILRRIGNQLGTLLKIDVRTVDSVRGRFARLCVQIDLDQPLTPKVRIGNIFQRVQYEGISAICFECECIGHKTSNCPSLIALVPPVQPPPESAASSSSILDSESSKYGD